MKEVYKMTTYESIDAFGHMDPEKVVKEMDELPSDILATRDPWTIVAAITYRDYREMEAKMSRVWEKMQNYYPVSTRPPIYETIHSIEESREVMDRSETGKGKKNRLMKNLRWINDKKQHFPHPTHEDQETLGVWA